MSLVSKQFSRIAAGNNIWRARFIKDQRDTNEVVEALDLLLTDWYSLLKFCDFFLDYII